jgi:hypothetical protein
MHMTYKQTAMHHKTLTYSGVGFPLNGLVAKIRSAIKSSIPVGYQDEGGFHTGVKRDDKQAKWPTTW